MNYYERHLGDYARDTSHLSLLEHGVYTLLLDRYYVTERPLPADDRELFRLLRASSKAERDAVRQVLSEFFEAASDGWRHSRCDAEIERFRVKASKARSSANARWSQRQPHAETDANAMRTHADGDANALPRQSEGNALQTPDSRLQTPEEETKNQEQATRSRGSPDDAAHKAERKLGTRIPDPFLLTASMREWAKREAPAVELESATREFCDYWRAIPGQRGRKLDWEATWRNRMREVQGRRVTARLIPGGKPPDRPPPTPEQIAQARREAAAKTAENVSRALNLPDLRASR